MRRNLDPPRRHQQSGGRNSTSLSSLTTLSALSAPPSVALARSKNGCGGVNGAVAGRPKAAGVVNGSKSSASSSSRFVRGSSMMSVMGPTRARSGGAGNGCCSSNGDMHSAAAAGDSARVGEHLRVGGDVDVRDGRQWSLLHHASFHGHLVVVRALLDAGADKEVCTAIELTPLCLACQNGHQEVVQELLDRGASVAGAVSLGSRGTSVAVDGRSESDKSGGGGGGGSRTTAASAPPTALFIATREGHVSLVDLLLRHRDGAAVSMLPGPDGKLAGEVFGKGVIEEARREIKGMLAEARERARTEDAVNVVDKPSGCLDEDEHKKHAVATIDPHDDERATTTLAVRGARHSSGSSSSSLSPCVASATNSRSFASFSPDTSLASAALPEGSVVTPATRAPVASLAGRSFGLNSIGSGRGLSAGTTSVTNSGHSRPDSDGIAEGSVGKTSGHASNGAHRGPSKNVVNGTSGMGHVADSSVATPRFSLAIEQPVSATAVAAATASSPVVAGGGGSTGRSLQRAESGEIGGLKQPLSAHGLPTPQEWQASVRQQIGLLPPSSLQPIQQFQMQQVSRPCAAGGASAAPGTPVACASSIGLGTDSPSLAPLAPVDEVFDGDDGLGGDQNPQALPEDVKARSRRSRSAGGRGDYPNVEFGGAHWLNHPVPPRCATAPPPAARSPSTTHVPLSPASYGHSGGGVGGGGCGGDKGDSNFEDKWGVAFSSLMDLRTLYRNSNRSSSICGRGTAWLAWEEERRSLEETISELNMRLAGRDHDIAELRMQVEERERDLRFMYGRDLKLLGLSELGELEKCLQTALGLVSAERERAVYRLLQEGGDGGSGGGGGGVIGHDDPSPSLASRS